MTLELALAAALSAIFVVSGGAKAVHRIEFRQALTSTYRLSGRAAVGVGRIVPAWEMATAAMLLTPATRPLGAASVGAFLGIAGTLAVEALARGQRGDCGCIPGVRSRLSKNTLWRLAAVASLDIGLILSLTLENERERGPNTFEFGPSAGLVLVGAILLVSISVSVASLLNAIRRT